MEPNVPPRLQVGDWLNCVVVRSLGGRRFKLRSSEAPKGWDVELHARRPETIQEGMQMSAWVVKIAPLQGQVLLHEGDFGRLPISDAMRPRYREGIRALLGHTEITGDNLADARSMVVRVQQQNQVDWLTVWKVLGEPTPGDVRNLLRGIDALRTARKEDPDSVNRLLEEMSSNFGMPLQRALSRLEAI